ncbi:MAG: type II toxin-antitoxin system VapC family toxin [Anaerolineales bacterium]|nr:type II toxin-antitoxin system VapC family toxin [Anaerolineales bacterium]
MRKVFVDTAAWIALINISDDLHVPAQQVMSALRQQKVRLVTTKFALLEVADALSAPVIRSQTAAFVDGLWCLSVLRIIPASHELLAEGWGLYKQRLDKEWSLTDCISFAVMTRERITQAFTSDHHFEQAGFVKLLSSE